MRPIPCEAVRARLWAEIDGEAEAVENTVVACHLEACRACRQLRASAESLRSGIAAAMQDCPSDDAQDEALLAMLRDEGICRTPSREAPEAAGRGRPEWLRRVSAALLSRHLAPSLAALTASFALTWGMLRWAEMPSAPDQAPAAGASVAQPLPDEDFLERWLAETPTLAAALRRVLPPPRPAPRKAG
jgi:predicted anti-sigma-YlaC factor YlaD